jgi:peptidoglycan hydrolase-like protein with peptidoglycan-binding domain
MRTDESQPEVVRRIQQKLAIVGYPAALDGVFGLQTDYLVRCYQSRHGLPVDGVVGPLTHASLFGPAE